MYYQQDATVNWPYGSVSHRQTPIKLPADYSVGKTRKVIWIVSRCDTPFAHREHYVSEVILVAISFLFYWEIILADYIYKIYAIFKQNHVE